MGMLLLIVYASPDSFSAYSPDDVKQWKMHFMQFLVKLSGLVILWLGNVYANGDSLIDFQVMFLFTSVLFIKTIGRSVAHIFASPSSIEERAKISELYLSHDLELSKDGDPKSMKNYNYLVDRVGCGRLTLEYVLGHLQNKQQEHLSDDKIVTLQKVWNCEGALLTQGKGRGDRLKDICLSYSLLQILQLKLTGCVLPEKVLSKESNLILEGLLNRTSGEDIERAFRVIEVELKLLYELIYTKYPLFSVAIFAGARVIEFILSLVACGLSAVYLTQNADSLGCIMVEEVKALDVLGTYVLLGMIVFTDITQMVMIFSSEWVKAALICNYVAKVQCLNNCFAEKLITRVCIPWLWKPWARKLGQYSLIKSCCYGSKAWISRMASTVYPDRNWDWQIERKDIKLSDDVKRVVLDSLRSIVANQDDRRNFLIHEYEWACKGQHVAEVILVWHIATSYFQHQSPPSASNKDVATELSNYLAYLVTLAPRLLPGPPFDPQYHTRRVMQESRDSFRGCKNVRDKIRKLNEDLDRGNPEGEKIILRGARLGKQLLELENRREDVWHHLAGFWSEMTLWAATSGEQRAHLEKLANGGEFITHLWVLLQHADVPRQVLLEKISKLTCQDAHSRN
ncbi:hypothetical protein MLD38_039416 [Melastoma candidum]|uniref:Uncharacterized protein n=1 Tax=Melastoma candidum TaxID=119954 RepID=A0ACB9L2F9_9MYRT|nr:hypothetical protein MLD38_039416 [Melastoma candidum]